MASLDDDSVEVNQHVHKQFGRDTEVGRLLYNIYNKGKTPYVPKVKVKTKPQGDPHQLHMKKLEQKRKELKAKCRPKVQVPKPASRNRVPRQKPKPFFDRGQGRKPLKQIEAEKHRVPLRRAKATGKSGRITREQSKNRLVEHLQGSKDQQEPRTLAPRRVRPQKPKPLPPPKTEEQVLFDSILEEINERKAFLRNMDALGKGAKHRRQIEREIAERVKELKVLDSLIHSASQEHLDRMASQHPHT